ncbi:MarR family winged helix-turn-helix transcriptional regulator [Methanobacterium sp.]|uniref:MarR family winged helix-turn-helix transcriptional regulator n=1 Tax=Methanobacterium sp. TaxID=2164 RepID=UPI003C713F53
MDNKELSKILNNIYILHQILTKNDPEWEGFKGHRNTYNYYLTLITLKERGKLPLSKIGRLVGIKRQNMTHVADMLVKKGLVTRVPCNEDRRVINLNITEKGEECLKEWQKSRIKMINKVFECFDEEELKKFLFHLKTLNNTFKLPD